MWSEGVEGEILRDSVAEEMALKFLSGNGKMTRSSDKEKCGVPAGKMNCVMNHVTRKIE